MAQITGRITFDFEPIVKLGCIMIDCKNNINGNCNLKNVLIGPDGQCTNLRLKVHIREIKDTQRNDPT